MGGINVARWLAGGVVAGIVMWLIEGVASMLYMEDMQTAMESLGVSMEMTAGTWVMTVLMSLLTGLVLVFFYAAARPRFGPGPKTAIIVAVALFVGGMLVTLMGYGMMGFYPTRLLLIWGCLGFVEMILASLAGAWVYRE
jgi:hypothetical protein